MVAVLALAALPLILIPYVPELSKLAVIVPLPVGANEDVLPINRLCPEFVPLVIALKLRVLVVESAVQVSVPSTAMPLK